MVALGIRAPRCGEAYLRKLFFVFFAVLPLTICAPVILAQTPIDFTGTALNQTNMVSSLGGVTSTTGEIISSADGIPISGGLLAFSTLAATSSFTFPDGFHNTDPAGGTFTLTGQIFGLPANSILFSGTLGSGQTIFESANPLAVSYFGQDNSTITYVNPVLSNGIPANWAGPVLIRVSNEFDQYPNLSNVTMNSLIAVSPTPEPSSWLLIGTGLLFIIIMSRKLLSV
jgi:hypothetical protein